jgi:DNA-binding response OmpR family regulator
MTKTVLVAEDDSFLAETLCLALEEHGVEVELACDGEEAMAALDQKEPDLLLLDLIMPKKDGIAVLQHIRDQNYHVPVVILSNLSTDMNPEKCMALGAKAYLVKSDMDEDELWPTVEKYL